MSSNSVPSVHQIGRYELLSSLGKGGMGRVFRARLTGPGGASKPVALKLIHEHLSAQESFTRLFHEELRIAMALNHRNIVQTFDGGESDGRQYLVMEFVPGLSLWEFSKRTRRGSPLPADIVLFIGMEVCAALDYGHNFRPEHTGHPGRVLHRDVSPTNILLSEQGDVKLTDYGVAKATGSIALTSPNLIKGKLPYMAPEQARGEPQVQSDLFSLGAVLYEMLGRRPIRDQVTLELVRDGKPEIISLASLRPDLPESLVSLVTQCLATAVDHRPESAWALREALADEAAELQQGPDLHGRMRSFFSDLTGEREPGSNSAVQLAEVMLKRAKAMPTNPAARSERHTALPTPITTPAKPHPKGRARRPLWVLAAGVSFSVVGMTTLLIWMLLPGGPNDRSPRVFVRPPDQRSMQTTARGAGRDSSPHVKAPPDARATRDIRATLDTVTPDQRVARKGRRPRGRGWLSVNAVPCAKVYIDGAYRGETPIQKLLLRAGRYRVRLVNPPLKLSTSLMVTIRPNHMVTRVVNLRHAE